MNRRAFTLLEALMVCLIGAVVLGSLIAFLIHSQTWTARATDQAHAVMELRVGLSRVTREIREARQVSYPGAGRKAQAGLGLVTPRGEAVMYHLVPAAPGGPSSAKWDLVRDVVGGAREVVVPRVTRLAVTVADPGAGREPSLVRLVLSRSTGAEDAGVSLVTGAAARAVQSRCVALRGDEP